MPPRPPADDGHPARDRHDRHTHPAATSSSNHTGPRRTTRPRRSTRPTGPTLGPPKTVPMTPEQYQQAVDLWTTLIARWLTQHPHPPQDE